MTTSNTPDQRIDDILAELTSAIWLQAQMAVIDKHESYGDKAESQKLAKSQLKSLFETMAATALGQDYLVCEKFPTELGTHCNNCFACSVEDNYDFNRGYENKTEEVRQRIPQVISKYLGGGE